MLSTMYVTYVVTMSDFPLMRKARDEVFVRYGDESWQSYLVTCGWCAGFWVSMLITFIVYAIDLISYPALIMLSSAAATGLLLEIVGAIMSLKVVVTKVLLEDG